MPLIDAGKDVALDAVLEGVDPTTSFVAYISLHDADPSTTGANEISGGTPAYARKAVTWNPSAAGIKVSSNNQVFDVDTGFTITNCGFWTAVTSGIFLGSGAVDETTFTVPGTFTITEISVAITG